MDEQSKAFAEIARRYCSYLEGGSAPNTWVFAQSCLAQLLLLYQTALLLPEVPPDSEDLLEGVDHKSWKVMCENIARRLARDCYWEVYEPLEQAKPDPVVGSLSDDLADIWRDLSSGVAAINSGTTLLNDVVWHWRISFETHWGQHAASAIVALHALCFGPLADGSRPSSPRDE